LIWGDSDCAGAIPKGCESFVSARAARVGEVGADGPKDDDPRSPKMGFSEALSSWLESSWEGKDEKDEVTSFSGSSSVRRPACRASATWTQSGGGSGEGQQQPPRAAAV
jgi:hypothetical protein